MPKSVMVWNLLIITFGLVSKVQCSTVVPQVELNNGIKIPIVGLGTLWATDAEAKQAVKDAIDVGYRHFDCAYIYRNEKSIGQAIEEKLAEGAVKREDLFIVSKLWNTFHNPELVEGAINITLKDLRLDYIDLYLMHSPAGTKEDGFTPTDYDYVDTWNAMELVYKKGLAKSIGISNFNKRQIQRLLEHSTVVPVTNQVESHPRLNQQKLIEFCKSKNITVTAFRPLGSLRVPSNETTLLEDPIIKKIGEKFRKSSAQILIRYQVQRGVIVIPKTVHKNRLIENLQVFDFTLSAEDMATINSLDIHGRISIHPQWVHHKYYPFNDEY